MKIKIQIREQGAGSQSGMGIVQIREALTGHIGHGQREIPHISGAASGCAGYGLRVAGTAGIAGTAEISGTAGISGIAGIAGQGTGDGGDAGVLHIIPAHAGIISVVDRLSELIHRELLSLWMIP